MTLTLGSQNIVQAQIGEHVIYTGWRQYTGSSQFFSSFTLLYRIHPTEKYLEIVISGVVALSATTGGSYQLIDMSSIVTGISVDGYNFNVSGSQNGAAGSSAIVKNDNIYFTPGYDRVFAKGSIASSVGAKGNPFLHISYENLT